MATGRMAGRAAPLLVATVRQLGTVDRVAGGGAVVAPGAVEPAGRAVAAVVGVCGVAAGRTPGIRGGCTPAGGARWLVVALVAHGRARQGAGPATAALATGPPAGHRQPVAGYGRG